MKPRVAISPNDWRGQIRELEVPLLTVQVVTRDRPQSLYGFLASLLAQTYQDWDLIIVDESDVPAWAERSSELHGLLEVISRLGHRVKAFHVQQRGIDGSYDVALEATETELALREEDDHVFEADYIQELILAYDAIPLEERRDIVGDGVGAVAGLSLDPRERLQRVPLDNPSALRNHFHWGPGEDGEIGLIPDDDQRTPIVTRTQAYPVGILHGMWLYNVHALREVGGFATVTNGWRGETATSLQLSWLGYSLWVCPQAVAYHLPGRPAEGSHRGQEGTQIRAEAEKEFQRWLQRMITLGRPVPVDLDWSRLAG